MWSGNVGLLPTGWVLCDGTNSTPNIKGTFIVGYNVSDVDNANGKTGGEKKHTLTLSEIPPHNYPNGGVGRIDGNANGGGLGHTANGSTYTTGMRGGSGGVALPHETRPPYHVLAYIMKQ